MGVPLELSNFLQVASAKERQALADAVPTTVSYLYQIASDPSRASKEMRERIAEKSGGQVVVTVQESAVAD